MQAQSDASANAAVSRSKDERLPCGSAPDGLAPCRLQISEDTRINPSMNRRFPAGKAPYGDRAFADRAFPKGLQTWFRGQSIRTGIFWMLGATCLFVCQDSTARVLLKTYPATEVAFGRYFVHMVLVSMFIAWHDPRLMISRQPMLQMLRSGFLLGATLFGMLALKIMPLVDFSAVVWAAPVLVTALYQITTRLLHRADLPVTTLFYTALAGVLYCGGFLPFVAVAPKLADAGLMLLLGLTGVAYASFAHSPRGQPTSLRPSAILHCFGPGSSAS
jgi:hypothetical protein